MEHKLERNGTVIERFQYMHVGLHKTYICTSVAAEGGGGGGGGWGVSSPPPPNNDTEGAQPLLTKQQYNCYSSSARSSRIYRYQFILCHPEKFRSVAIEDRSM